MFITLPLLQLLVATTALASAPLTDDIPNIEPVAEQRIPPFSIIPCPPSCPCCDWCEPLTQCRSSFLPMKATYNKIRNLIGCDSLPEETPMCPVGFCNNMCICREGLFKELEDALVGSGAGRFPEQRPDDAETIDEGSDISQNRFPEILPGASRLVPELPPWYAVKPVCPKDCPCCDWCQPIKTGPGCKPYKAKFYSQPYPATRQAVGCDVLPATTPLCPIGECRGDCMCRESLLERVKGIFFGEEKTEEPRVEHEEL